jgi:general secretion pathway protein I
MRQGADTRGFTLIEVLIAFTIAAVMLVPLLQGFSAGINSAARTNNFTEATLIAESALETAGSGLALADGNSLDQQEGRYRVATAVHRYQDATASRPLLLAIPYEIVVTVSWQEAARARSVALRTLRLGPPPAVAEQRQ